MTAGCQLVARPSSIIHSRTPVRNGWTMSAVRTIQSHGQCLQWMKSRGALFQTWRPSVRLHSSARPLPDEQYDYPWHSNGINHYARPMKSTVILPRTTPKMELSIEPTPKATVSLKGHISSVPEMDLTDPFQAVSPNTLRYTGDAVMPITSKLHIVTPQEDAPRGVWPIFRLMVCPLLCVVDRVRRARLPRISTHAFCFDRTKPESFATRLGMDMTTVTFNQTVVSARCHWQTPVFES
jgi:hypothetical protein